MPGHGGQAEAIPATPPLESRVRRLPPPVRRARHARLHLLRPDRPALLLDARRQPADRGRRPPPLLRTGRRGLGRRHGRRGAQHAAARSAGRPLRAAPGLDPGGPVVRRTAHRAAVPAARRRTGLGPVRSRHRSLGGAQCRRHVPCSLGPPARRRPGPAAPRQLAGAGAGRTLLPGRPGARDAALHHALPGGRPARGQRARHHRRAALRRPAPHRAASRTAAGQRTAIAAAGPGRDRAGGGLSEHRRGLRLAGDHHPGLGRRPGQAVRDRSATGPAGGRLRRLGSALRAAAATVLSRPAPARQSRRDGRPAPAAALGHQPRRWPGHAGRGPLRDRHRDRAHHGQRPDAAATDGARKRVERGHGVRRRRDRHRQLGRLGARRAARAATAGRRRLPAARRGGAAGPADRTGRQPPPAADRPHSGTRTGRAT